MNIVFYLAVISLQVNAWIVSALYEPGTPGAVWSEKEIKVVRGKIIRMLDSAEYRTGGTLGRIGAFREEVQDGPNKGKVLFDNSDKSWINVPMPSRVIRLAFHDCVSSWDGQNVGEGKKSGCDGCLYWDDDEMNFLYTKGDEPREPEDRTVKSNSFHYDIPKGATNNGLKTIVKALEYVYDDPTWPPGAEKLETSLKESGKSRADLWQFAANVGLELEIERSNFACKYDKKNQQAGVLEGGGEEGCFIKLQKPLPFKFGRKDCISDGGYKTSNLETPFDPHGGSKEILEGMHREFNLTKEESIALMATHSTAPIKPNERENVKYGWIGNYLGNMYYKYLAMSPTYMVKQGMNSLVPDNLILRGDQNGNPVDGRRWRMHCFNQWKKEKDDDKFSGPFIFRPTSEGCRRRVDGCDEAKCEQLFETKGSKEVKAKFKRISELCAIGFRGNHPEVVKDKEVCDTSAWINENSVLFNGTIPEFVPTKLSRKAIKAKKPIDPKSGVNSLCDKLPLFALSYEMNFVYDFNVDKNKRPMMGDDVNEAMAKDRKTLLKSDFPKNQETFGIIEEFASKQDVWAEKFFEGWEKMQNNVVAYNLIEDPTKASWLGYSFFSKDSYENVMYPLTFTDNQKANPKFFARTNNPNPSFRLAFTNFHEICQKAKYEDKTWLKNDLGQDYNPCPSELMEDISCPIPGCDTEKCSIHWSLCN